MEKTSENLRLKLQNIKINDISRIIAHSDSRCYVAAFVSLCDHSHIPIALMFLRSPGCFATYVLSIYYTSNTSPLHILY